MIFCAYIYRMKKKNPWRIYVFSVVLCLLILVVGASYFFINYATERHSSPDNLITFVLTILSVVVAFLAYHISMKTYISIDSVNAISRMDGNVMENRDYRTNISSIIRQFDGKDRDEAGRQILRYLERTVKASETVSGAKLADSIQGMIDVIVLIPLIIRPKADDAKNISIINRILSLEAELESRIEHFESLSEGSCILIRESVKLMNAVYNYQFEVAGSDTVEALRQSRGISPTEITDVRGPMLRNAISLTIYYNYLGLTYMSKAHALIKAYFGGKVNPYSIDASAQIESMPDSLKKEKIVILLEEALADFDKAVATISDELMWNAFIQYNRARAQYFLSLLTAPDDPTWHETMRKAIGYRYKLVLLLSDVIGGGRSYLLKAFEAQLTMARLMDIRLCIARGIPEPSGQLPDVGADEFLRCRESLDDILRHR